MRQSYLSFINEFSSESAPARHHLLLIDKLQQVADGKLNRLMVFMPPGAAKSYYANVMFSAWWMAKNPGKKLITASYSQEVADKWGRRVRAIAREPAYEDAFGAKLSQESQAAGRWALDNDTEFYGVGVGGSITSFRADGAIIDDPVKGREDAESETIRNKTKEWYLSDFWTRLKPGAFVTLIMCMTGDTKVLMANGAQKHLKNVKIGDEIATYKNGKISKSKIINWINHGPDSVLEIKTSSGIISKANERHPFLVIREGNEQWVRLKNLVVGDKILKVIGANGEELNAPLMDAESQQNVRDIATHITTNQDGQKESGHHPSTQNLGERLASNTDTALRQKITIKCSPNKEACAHRACSLPEVMLGRIGEESYASTIATNPAKLGACSATTAISRLDMGKQPKHCLTQQDTYKVVLDEIVSITPAGREDVYDVQVEETENFIADGLISHNTRWHEDDLAGYLLDMMKKGGEQWEVLSLPMLAEGTQDPLGRKEGEPLWPEWFTDEMIAQAKRDPRNWSSLYQQRPTPETGAYFESEWFKMYDKLPSNIKIYGASDYAVSEGGGDYTVHGVFGLDTNENIYVLDWWRGQKSSLDWVEQLILMIKTHKPVTWFEEAGVIYKSMNPLIAKRQQETGAWCARKQIVRAKSKEMCAQSIRGRMQQGKVYFPYASWYADLKAEMLSFPAGKHDDQVDVMALIGMAIGEMGTAKIDTTPIYAGHGGWS